MKNLGWLLLLLPLLATAEGIRMEINTVRNGYDYRSFPTHKPGKCLKVCQREKQCKAFSYILDQQRCYLKSSVPNASRDHNAVSGVKPKRSRDKHRDKHPPKRNRPDKHRPDRNKPGWDKPDQRKPDWGQPYRGRPDKHRQPHKKQRMFIEYDTDRYGNDYRSDHRRSTRACANWCQREARCRAFSFLKTSKRCHLKDGVPRASFNRDVDSGIKKERRRGRGRGRHRNTDKYRDRPSNAYEQPDAPPYQGGFRRLP